MKTSDQFSKIGEKFSKRKLFEKKGKPNSRRTRAEATSKLDQNTFARE